MIIDKENQYLSKRKSKRKLKCNLLKHVDIFCCFCGEKLTKNTISVEHIIPKKDFGNDKEKDNINNITFSCINCNLNRGRADFVLYRNYKLNKLKPPEYCREFYLQKQLEKISPKLKKKVLQLFNCGFDYFAISKVVKAKNNTVKLICLGR